MSSQLTITVSELRKSYGSRVILDGVSLSVRTGETVAIIGPSGGGKSTLLRSLNLLSTFDGGQVEVGPHVLLPGPEAGANAESARQVRRLLGMVFQDYQLFPHLTALQNVIEAPVQVRGMERKAAREMGEGLLRRVGLGDQMHQYPHQLSGGQKQRVAIARALAMEPRGLLCDEITSALDPELKAEVLDVLEQLKEAGLTLMMVTHEIGFARRAADRVLVLAEGRIIEEGPASAVIERPREERTRVFLQRVLG